MSKEKRTTIVTLNNITYDINGVIDVKKRSGKRYFNIRKKQLFLDAKDPFKSKLKLIDRVFCMHCGETITVGDYKIELLDGYEYICCPNAPKCSGTIIDWQDNKEL